MAQRTHTQSDPTPRVAIIGGGIAGLACAAALHSNGVQSVVFDRGRRVGGRMSTKRCEHNGIALEFDHGATRAEIRTDEFRAFVDELTQAGIADVAMDGDQQVCVGTRSMQEIAQHLGMDLDIHSSTEVVSLSRSGNGWVLQTKGYNESELAEFFATHLVFACPITQANRVLANSDISLPNPLVEHTDSHQSWSCMFLISSDTQLPDLPRWIEANDGSSETLISIVRESDRSFRVVVQRSESNTETHQDEIKIELAHTAFTEISSRLDESIDSITYSFIRLHRWGLAFPVSCVKMPFFVDQQSCIAFCGDTFTDEQSTWSGVEAAYMSGTSLGKHLASNACSAS